MLSRAPSRIVCSAWLSAAAVSFAAAADAAVLIPLDGLPHADGYDTFLVAEDAAGLSNPILGIVPKQLEFDLDNTTKRPKFGIQYDFSGNQNFISLTASLRYRQAPGELKDITAAAESRLGMNAGTLRLASLNVFTTTVSFFYRTPDNSIKTNAVLAARSPLTATYPVVVDLSSVPKSQVRDLLTGSAATGGFVGRTESNAAVYERKNDASDWEAIVDWARSFKALSVRQLALPSNSLAKSRPDVRLAIALALGTPSVVAFEGSYIFGWDMSPPSVASQLKKIVDDAKSRGPLLKISDKYENGIIMTLDNVCSTMATQIVDISSGATGCTGLEQ